MMRNCAVLFALVLVALAVALAGLQVSVASAAEAPLQVSADRHGPDALLVKVRAGVTADQAEATLRRHGAAAARRFQPPRSLPASPIGRWWHVRLAPGTDLRRTLNRLAGDPAVERAELDYEVGINLTPNDPSFSQLWGLNNIGQTGGTSDADVDAPEAWDLQTGKSEVLVAVIDTGADYTHPDLAANVWTNPGEIPGNGLDDDGNGYVDDVHGYDFANNDADPFDDHGHGTHVSGTIAAVGNNGIGVAGVNWTARIMAVKFLGAGGSGFTSGAINAILYAAGMGARVMSNSWGGGGFSQALMDAITTADNAGALFVAAAGNSGSNNDATPNYPSNYDVPNVLAVAATDHTDAKASFSSYGATTVDLGAPGVSIYSTVPASGALCCSDPSGYKLLSGTSMATPHVSGAAALVFAQFPGITHHQVKARLMGAADPVPSLAGITVTGGRLNAFKSLENDLIEPAAVTDLAVSVVGSRSVTLTWTATGDDGTAGTASSYDLRYATAPITDATFATATRVTAGVPAPGPAGTVQLAKVAGLEPGTAYSFALKVVDNVGNASLLSNVPTAATQAVAAVFSDNLEAGGGNWTVTGSDGVGGPALWHLSAHRASSPTTAFYYGREATLTYNTGAANSGAITSGPISLSGTTDPTLTFRHFLATENYPAPVFDVARVEVSGDGGLTWQALLVTSTGTAGAMVSQAVDLSAYGGKVIQVRFRFDTGDAALNDFEGWVVDDVAVTVAAVNGAPTANAGGPYSGFKRQAIVLDGSGSSDPEGSLLTYAWNFGDGTTGTGVAPTHAYAAAGIYTVTLVVNDGTASSTPATTTVTVANRAPTANPGGPYVGVVGSPVAFTGAGSSDPDGDPLTYGWDFGDGTTGTGVNPTHVYGAGGTFTVTLIVNDGAASSGPATTTVAMNQPPVANAGPDQTVKQRTTATLNGTASSDPDGSIVGYAWTQVSGTPVTLSGASSAVATFTAPDLVKSVPVVLVFELAVTDDRGARAADQVAVTVSVR